MICIAAMIKILTGLVQIHKVITRALKGLCKFTRILTGHSKQSQSNFDRAVMLIHNKITYLTNEYGQGIQSNSQSNFDRALMLIQGFMQIDRDNANRDM